MQSIFSSEPLGMEITPENHDAWLEERRNSLGASEAAAAVGVCPYTSPLELYLRKLGLAPEVESTEAMALGHLMEPVVLELYRRNLGDRGEVARFAQQRFVRSPEHTWMTATLDAVRDDGRIVELKAVGWRMAEQWGEPGTDEVPDRYLCQVLHQLAVTGEDEADLAVLIGGQDFRVYTIPRSRALDLLVAREEAFWRRVQDRTPPEPSQPSDARLMAALHPGVDGVCELTGDDAHAAACYAELGATIRDLERARDLHKARVLAAMGRAARAIVPGLGVLSRRVVSVDAATVERKAYSFVDLRLKKARNGDGQAR